MEEVRHRELSTACDDHMGC